MLVSYSQNNLTPSACWVELPAYLMGLPTLSCGSHDVELYQGRNYIRVKNSKKTKKTILKMLEKSNIVTHGIETFT